MQFCFFENDCVNLTWSVLDQYTQCTNEDSSSHLVAMLPTQPEICKLNTLFHICPAHITTGNKRSCNIKLGPQNTAISAAVLYYHSCCCWLPKMSGNFFLTVDRVKQFCATSLNNAVICIMSPFWQTDHA